MIGLLAVRALLGLAPVAAGRLVAGAGPTAASSTRQSGPFGGALRMDACIRSWWKPSSSSGVR